jgi:F-type H+-transporting ATPase subunit gamma
MAQLIQMRNRIKAVQTIKKITHAMRLIAMSNHSKLQEKRKFLQHYHRVINHIFSALHHVEPSWKSSILSPAIAHKQLIILIGSQKGLCGTFNEALFRYFEQQYMQSHPKHSYDVIAVGEKVVDYCTNQKLHLINTFREFNTSTLTAIADEIASFMIEAEHSYKKVIIYHNYPKSFFSQKPSRTIVIPTQESPIEESIELEEYVWEQSPSELLDYLVHVYLKSTIEFALFESLMAEAAARFVSMDSSTRNAEDVLDDLQLEYNKTRQAKITRELSELMGSY